MIVNRCSLAGRLAAVAGDVEARPREQPAAWDAMPRLYGQSAKNLRLRDSETLVLCNARSARTL